MPGRRDHLDMTHRQRRIPAQQLIDNPFGFFKAVDCLFDLSGNVIALPRVKFVVDRMIWVQSYSDPTRLDAGLTMAI